MLGVEHLADEWPAWRLWYADKATMEEIDRSWTYDMIMTACQLLDAFEEAEATARRQAPRKGKKP